MMILLSFDGHGTFLFSNGGSGQDVIIFGADMRFSVHVDNEKKKIFLFLVKLLHK